MDLFYNWACIQLSSFLHVDYLHTDETVAEGVPMLQSRIHALAYYSDGKAAGQ